MENNKEQQKAYFWTAIKILVCFVLTGCSPAYPKEPAVVMYVSTEHLAFFGPYMTTYAATPDGTAEVNIPVAQKLEEPEWSPDRRWVISSTRFSEAKGYGNSEIYLTSYDGVYTAQVTNNPEKDISPSWSPDGKQIIYYASYPNQSGIYLLDVACWLNKNTGCKPEPHFLAKGERARWSPVSNEILVEVRQPNDGLKLFIYELDSKVMRDLGIFGEDAIWSPDGKHIAYSSLGRLTLVKNSDGTGGYYSSSSSITIVNSNGTGAYTPLPEGIGGTPFWTPDGEHLLFVTSKLGGYGHPFKYEFEGNHPISNGVMSLNLKTMEITRVGLFDIEDIIWYAWYPGAPDN